MRTLLSITLSLIFFATAFAQQESQFTQFMHNKLVINPGYAGVPGVPVLTALHRNQWMGFEGNPQTTLLSFHTNLVPDKVGLGLTVANFRVGLFNNYMGSMAYSYRIEFSEKADLRIGLQVAARRYEIDFSEQAFLRNIDLVNPDDNYLNNVMDMQVNDFNASFGAGAFLRVSNAFLGVSVPNLYNGDILINETTDGSFTSSELPHFYGMAGVEIPVSANVKVTPQVMAKYVENAPFDLDANVMAMFNDALGVGASYRLGGEGSGESIDFLLFFNFGNLSIGGAYDYSLTELQDYSSGSVEAVLKYYFRPKTQTNMENPRYFE